MAEKILVVDDEKHIADAIGYGLKKEGYTVEIAYNGEEALSKAIYFKPNAVILDIMMPKLNGYDVLKRLDNKKNIGIIMLTAKTDIVDKVLGLELGADDYMTKPFDMRELIARLKSLVRRLGSLSSALDNDICLGNLQIILKQRKVIVNDEMLDLTPKEFDLLALLLSSPERVYTRDELLDLVWGIDYIGGTRTVDIHIQRLRKKLGNDFKNILETVHGVGYKAIKMTYEK